MVAYWHQIFERKQGINEQPEIGQGIFWRILSHGDRELPDHTSRSTDDFPIKFLSKYTHSPPVGMLHKCKGDRSSVGSAGTGSPGGALYACLAAARRTTGGSRQVLW